MDNSTNLTQENPSDITAKLEPRFNTSSASALTRLNNNFTAASLAANSMSSSVSHMDTTSNDYSIRPPSSSRSTDPELDHRPGSRQRSDSDNVWADSKSRDVWNSSPQPSPQSNDRDNQMTSSSTAWGEHVMMKQEIRSEAE